MTRGSRVLQTILCRHFGAIENLIEEPCKGTLIALKRAVSMSESHQCNHVFDAGSFKFIRASLCWRDDILILKNQVILFIVTLKSASLNEPACHWITIFNLIICRERIPQSRNDCKTNYFVWVGMRACV